MISVMAKKTIKTDKRETIQVPADWHRCLVRLAGRWKQQKIWAFMRLVGEACDTEGIERPPFPWEEMEKGETVD